MRAYQETIREAELLASSPETIASYLRDRGLRLRENKRLDEGDEKLEKALLALDHPLINLALAGNCRFPETAQDLFYKEPANLPLRLAVLSNNVACLGMSLFPQRVFGDDEATTSFLGQASQAELNALFENPNLADSFLGDFLNGSAGWQALSEKQRQSVVFALIRNTRMKAPLEDDYPDGFAEFNVGSVFEAAWKLAATVPTSARWASALNYLFRDLTASRYGVDQPLAVAARWRPQDQAGLDAEAITLGQALLSDYQGVRQGLARLALARREVSATELLDSEDGAFRAAAYAYAALSAEQIKTAYKRDGAMVVMEIFYNHKLWQTLANREALEEVAWAVQKSGKHASLDAAPLFNFLRDAHFKDHPEWFRDEEVAVEDEAERAATKGDIQDLASNLSTVELAALEVKRLLQTNSTHFGGFWWFAIGVLAGGVFLKLV